MYSKILIMVDLSFSSLTGLGATARSAVARSQR
jgi:hypothetical protein